MTTQFHVGALLVWLIHVEGLGKRDAATYLQTEITRRAFDLDASSKRALRHAYALTAGIPYALKRLLSQAQTWGVAPTLDYWRDARTSAAGELYGYLFTRDWQALDDRARRLWLYLGRVVPTSIAREHLRRHAVSSQDFDAAVQQLQSRLLVETRASAVDTSEHLSLHPPS